MEKQIPPKTDIAVGLQYERFLCIPICIKQLLKKSLSTCYIFVSSLTYYETQELHF